VSVRGCWHFCPCGSQTTRARGHPLRLFGKARCRCCGENARIDSTATSLRGGESRAMMMQKTRLRRASASPNAVLCSSNESRDRNNPASTHTDRKRTQVTRVAERCVRGCVLAWQPSCVRFRQTRERERGREGGREGEIEGDDVALRRSATHHTYAQSVARPTRHLQEERRGGRRPAISVPLA
jgi:hypothetical protein